MFFIKRYIFTVCKYFKSYVPCYFTNSLMQANLYFIHLYNFSFTSLKHSYYDNTLHNEERNVWTNTRVFYSQIYIKRSVSPSFRGCGEFSHDTGKTWALSLRISTGHFLLSTYIYLQKNPIKFWENWYYT